MRRGGRWAVGLALAALALSGCRKVGAPEHLELAKEALFHQKPDLALAEYKQALDVLERDGTPQAAVYRARALRGAADTYAFELHDYKKATAVYRELISVCPEAPETLEGRIHLARLLESEFHDLRGAIAELKAALVRNPPKSAELAYKVATLYFALQDYGQCEIEAAQVASRYENSGLVDHALFLRGQALAMLDGRKLEAQRVYMDLVDRFGSSELKPHALFELGRLKADSGESERAIELWVESLKTHPEPKVVQGSIARVRAHLRATTPDGVGDVAKAFDLYVPGAYTVEKTTPQEPPKSSAEAVGASKEEAEREAHMKAEGGHDGEAPPVPAPAPAPEPATGHGESGL